MNVFMPEGKRTVYRKAHAKSARVPFKSLTTEELKQFINAGWRVYIKPLKLRVGI